MVREIREPKLSKKLRDLASSRFFIPFALLLIVVLSVPVISLVTSKPVDIRQRAAPSTPTATMNISPTTGSVVVGQQFTISLVIDGGGQTFNAAGADITVSSNLSVQTLNIVPPASGGCNFTFVNANKTPKVSDPSFAGAILNGSSTNCTLMTLTLQANSAGTGTITLSKTSVKSYVSHQDTLLSYQNGSYTIGTGITPTSTPVPTAVPTATPTSIPPTLTPTVAPTATPIPTVTPTPTPIVVSPPTINSMPTDTYQNILTLGGTKSLLTVGVYVNNSTTNVTYPTSTTWQYASTLIVGVNNFNVFGKDANGNSSSVISVAIDLHRVGDISGDNIIDLTDLSIFGSDWEKTGSFNSALSDMDGDNVVDLTDFSILAAVYGN
jgi:hypothetical protein